MEHEHAFYNKSPQWDMNRIRTNKDKNLNAWFLQTMDPITEGTKIPDVEHSGPLKTPYIKGFFLLKKASPVVKSSSPAHKTVLWTSSKAWGQSYAVY